jgi:hypothetical protein
MKRTFSLCALALAAAVAAPVVQADVKTREKTTFALEGFLGGVVRVFGGRAAREGIESTVAVKGGRKATINNTTGQIVDLGEEKVYNLDVRRREYRVTTFAELRAQFEKAKADAAKQAEEARPEDKEQMEQAARELEFDVDVRETGQRREIIGHQTREVVLTITGREKGRTLEQSGGFVLTNTLWLAPRIAALAEMMEFDLKYVRAVYGESFLGDMQQMAGMMAMYPAFAGMASRMQEEGRKLEGTSLATTMVFEAVKSEEQMKAAASQQQSSGGGGIGGMLGRRMMGNRGEPQPRTKILTTTHEMLSVDTTVADADVAIPTNYRLRN